MTRYDCPWMWLRNEGEGQDSWGGWWTGKSEDFLLAAMIVAASPDFQHIFSTLSRDLPIRHTWGGLPQPGRGNWVRGWISPPQSAQKYLYFNRIHINPNEMLNGGISGRKWVIWRPWGLPRWQCKPTREFNPQPFLYLNYSYILQLLPSLPLHFWT